MSPEIVNMLQRLNDLNWSPANTDLQRNVLFFPQKKGVAALTAPASDPLTPTIFHEPWWLDLVTNGTYKIVEVRENDEVVGRLPYFPKKRFGMRYSIMPPMTHFLGPAIVEGEGSPSLKFMRNAQITRDLIAQLPPASIYKYKCHRDITDTIAFQQEKFMTKVQFTHEIAPEQSEVLWKKMRSQKRRKIRLAQQLLTVTMDDMEPLEFWDFYDRNLQKKSIHNVCEKELTLKLIEGALQRKRGRIYAARNATNDVVAAIFCVWDATSSYYFMSTRTQEAHNGAISLVTWEAIKDATSRGLIFDFDGLNNGNAVLFFTEFGGTVSQRYIVSRETTVGALAMAAKDMFRESRYFY